MKIHGTAKGAALSTKDFGVAFGGAVAAEPYPDSLGSDADSTSVDATLNTSDEILGTGCFEFNGSSNYCVLPNDLDTILTGNFSIGIWAYVSDASATNATVINKPAEGDWSSPYHSFTIAQNGANFEFATNDGSTYVVLQNATGGTGWHWLLVTHTSGDLFSFYVDNDTPATFTNTPTWGTQAWMLGNTFYNSRFWDGYIDDIVFLSRILTSDERISIYNSGSGNLASTLDHDDIIAYYTMDDIALPNSAIPVS